MKICIDPGHGGFDPGAIGPTGLKEKDVNLKLALLLGAGLTDCGHKIFFTRQEDHIEQNTIKDNLVYIVKVANENKCDYLISLHENSVVNTAATGTEVFCNLNNPMGVRLAESILKCTVGMTGRADRGVKDGNGLYVIKHSRMTAVVVETLFISNSLEERMLKDNIWLCGYASGLAKVIDSTVRNSKVTK